jgi:sugar lactone lactonase YvrE
VASGAPLAVDALQLPGPSYYPESIGVAPDGTLYVGSAASGEVVKFSPGQLEAATFLPAGTVKSATGVLVDATTKSLLLCAVDLTFASAPSVQRFDLTTGAHLATFSVPGSTMPDGGIPHAFPNDMAFDGAHNLYVTDSFLGRVYVVTDVTTSAAMTVWATDPTLAPATANSFGADGISWDGAGSFYVNNNSTGAIVAIPKKADGTAGAATPIALSPSLANPDGQRQVDAHTLLVIDNAGTLSTVAVSGTSGAVTQIASRLDAPTSVVVWGSSYWVTEGQLTTSFLTGKPPNLPFLVRRIDKY